MKFNYFLCFLLFASYSYVFAQQQMTLNIDDFTTGSNTMLLVVDSYTEFPYDDWSADIATEPNSIVGTERDIVLTIYDGNPNIIASSNVTSNEGLYAGAGPSISGSILLQWDGTDNSDAIDTMGLGPIDFTRQNGNSIHVQCEVDLETEMEIKLYTSVSVEDLCSITIQLYPDVREYIANFGDFTGRVCHFDKVGAVEIIIPLSDSNNIFIENVGVFGPSSPLPSPPPTPLGDFTTYLVIDDFEVASSGHVVVVSTEQSPFPKSANISQSISEDHVLGGERDLRITGETGDTGLEIETFVANGSWQSSTASRVVGYATLNYNGEDSWNLHGNGLDCVDLTVGGSADGFLFQAQSTTETVIKFNIFGRDRNQVFFSQTVSHNYETYYYLPFNTFVGDPVDFTCINAIQLTATIQTYSQFIVDILVVGKYIPPPISESPSPTRSPTKTPLISAYMEGPTLSRTPTPTRNPAIDYECNNSNDCLYLSNECTVSYCIQHICLTEPYIGSSECCSEPSDCSRDIYGNSPLCVDNYCQFQNNNNQDDPTVHNFSSNNADNEDTEGNGATIGIITGVIAAGVIFIGIACCLIILVAVVIKVKKSKQNPTNIYNTMVGDFDLDA